MRLSGVASLLCAAAVSINAIIVERSPRNLVMKILPLGDSITAGFQSSDSNGYRLTLLKDLQNNGNRVQYVGDLHPKKFPGDYHEGLSGTTINEIVQSAIHAIKQRPNIVLLLAGTNDIERNLNVGDAPARLNGLIDTVRAICPDAVVLVGKIPKNKSHEPVSSARIVAYNNGIEGIVASRIALGQHIVLVNMFDALVRADLFDNLHPNDIGYRKMANSWGHGLERAAAKGWIRDPIGPIQVAINRKKCDHVPHWAPYYRRIATGAGLGTSFFPAEICRASRDPGVLEAVNSNSCICVGNGPDRNVDKIGASCQDTSTPATSSIRFADLNGDGRAEFLHVDAKGKIIAYLNGASKKNLVNWIHQPGLIATGVGGRRDQIHFADIDGDGRAEYLWVHDDGSVSAWQNIANRKGGLLAASPIWNPVGKIAAGIGKDGAGVRFADLNGDGRAEYIWISDYGPILAYVNLKAKAGTNPVKVGWSPAGQIADFDLPNQRENVVFADLNGDGRAEYIYISRADGSYTEYLNQGGPDNGLRSANVRWERQVASTFSLLNTVPGGGAGTNVQFADLDGDGRAEYLNVDVATSAVDAWVNGC